MAAEQGKDTPAGKVPVLNIERIYSTTVPADELARALAGHFRAKEFEAQVFRAGGERTVMQARKESLWRNLLGVAYALTVVFTPGGGSAAEHRPGGPRVGRCGDQRGDRAGGGPAGAAGDRLWHLEGEPAGQGGLAGDRRAGQRGNRNRPVRCPQIACLTAPRPQGVAGVARDACQVGLDISSQVMADIDPRAEEGLTMGFVTARGSSFYYEEQGDGPPI